HHQGAAARSSRAETHPAVPQHRDQVIEAIAAEPEAVEGVKGITITQREDFVIRPFETELEEISDFMP
ncbi:MAG: hypothetical protein RKO66_14330, partial [Candidatus Contendobacter sp.]|nr:hypothetical protein [Candidatus Contendobacter sp.]